MLHISSSLAAVLAASASYAFGNVYAKRRLATVDPLSLTTGTFAAILASLARIAQAGRRTGPGATPRGDPHPDAHPDPHPDPRVRRGAHPPDEAAALS